MGQFGVYVRNDEHRKSAEPEVVHGSVPARWDMLEWLWSAPCESVQPVYRWPTASPEASVASEAVAWRRCDHGSGRRLWPGCSGRAVAYRKLPPLRHSTLNSQQCIATDSCSNLTLHLPYIFRPAPSYQLFICIVNNNNSINVWNYTYSVSQKTGLLGLISYNFPNSQHLLIIFGRHLIQFSTGTIKIFWTGLSPTWHNHSSELTLKQQISGLTSNNVLSTGQ